jgi:hypothetical protein
VLSWSNSFIYLIPFPHFRFRPSSACSMTRALYPALTPVRVQHFALMTFCLTNVSSRRSPRRPTVTTFPLRTMEFRVAAKSCPEAPHSPQRKIVRLRSSDCVFAISTTPVSTSRSVQVRGRLENSYFESSLRASRIRNSGSEVWGAMRLDLDWADIPSSGKGVQA